LMLAFGPEAQLPVKRTNTINNSHGNFITNDKNGTRFGRFEYTEKGFECQQTHITPTSLRSEITVRVNDFRLKRVIRKRQDYYKGPASTVGRLNQFTMFQRIHLNQVAASLPKALLSHLRELIDNFCLVIALSNPISRGA
jgi:hypothetical protein